MLELVDVDQTCMTLDHHGRISCCLRRCQDDLGHVWHAVVKHSVRISDMIHVDDLARCKMASSGFLRLGPIPGGALRRHRQDSLLTIELSLRNICVCIMVVL